MSKHKWVSEVLSDLELYCKNNDLPLTREFLSDARISVILEVSQKPEQSTRLGLMQGIHSNE